MILNYWDAILAKNILPDLKDNTSILTSSIRHIFKDFAPQIKINTSEASIPGINRNNSIRKQSSHKKDEFLNVDSLNDSTDMIIPPTKDNLQGPNSLDKRIQEILNNQALGLDSFKNFRREQSLLSKEQYESQNALKVVFIFLIDLLFQQKLLTFEQIKQSVVLNDFSIKPNSQTLLSLQSNGIPSPFQDIQIKKIFLQYYVHILQNRLTHQLLQQYPIIFPIIQIIILNYISQILSKQRFEDFYQQYTNQKVNPQLFFQIIAHVFQLTVQKRGQNEHTIKFQTKRIVITEENGILKSKIE